MSLILFIFLDLLTLKKIPFSSLIINRFNKVLQYVFFIITFTIIYYSVSFILPTKYISIISQQGGNFQGLVNLPIIGFIFRLVYAVLSPFPWLGFSQFELYGNNGFFLFLHILSSLGASWIIFSSVTRFKFILSEPDQIKLSFLFGLSILFSLSFSSIGYHVYLAPALPFLAVINCSLLLAN